MPLVPTDFPSRLAARGLSVQVFSDWTTCGGSADQRAVVLHHTASSSSASPSSDAAYCHHGPSDAPLYNVLVDRTGVVWLLARNKANSSGKISGTALNEAKSGRAGPVSAIDRGLGDTTSDNAGLFAIAAQNNGVGEPWSAALVNAMNITAAVALECLGIPNAGYVTQHRVLTARKIDCCGDACPYDFQPGIATALAGTTPTPPPVEVRDMWTTHKDLPAGESRDKPSSITIGLPAGRKSASVTIYCPCDPKEGASLWGAVDYVGTKQGLWGAGKTWEQYLPGQKAQTITLAASAQAIELQHMGGTKTAVTVTLSGE
jgi:hypothetical protein